MPLMYITIDQAVEIHAKTVEVSGGGSQGMLDKGRLESVLDHIRNDSYYPSFLDKITHLFFCANKFHCFQDGNKRIAITLSAQFLLFNGYMYCVPVFMREMENISYHLAAGKIDKEFLRDLIGALINESYDDNEELKLRLLNAIQDDL
ncbi:MAG: type II toxin-antitoxin system death-on-curing family toxin [Desulfobulbaceae bacterium]|nr:type II toxin-antitoxin system death-on-curing family toxin [Desulfobulbaceae bacterium]